MEIKNKINSYYIPTIIVGFSIISSLVIYAIIVEIIKYQNKPFLGFSSMPVNEIIHYAILGAGILPFFLIIYLKDLINNNAISDNMEATLNKLKTYSIISYAICEIPAIIGFVLFMLWGFSFDFYLLLSLSFILEYKCFPRFNNWEEIIKNQV